jgi:hypothetical protein
MALPGFGAMSAIVFLALNSYDFEAPENDLSEVVYGRREVRLKRWMWRFLCGGG